MIRAVQHKHNIRLDFDDLFQMFVLGLGSWVALQTKTHGSTVHSGESLLHEFVDEVVLYEIPSLKILLHSVGEPFVLVVVQSILDQIRG